MMLFTIIVCCLVLYQSYRRGHYVLFLFLAITSLYELPFIIISNLGTGSSELVSSVMEMIFRSVLAAEFSSGNLSRHVLVFLMFILVTSVAYVFALQGRHLKTNGAASNDKLSRIETRIVVKKYTIFLFVLFLFGMTAYYYGAGYVQLLDYSGNQQPATIGLTALFYGKSLIVILIPLLFFLFSSAKGSVRYVFGFYILLAALPLIIQTIITGRRQYIVPMLLSLFLLVIYADNIKRKKVIIAVGLLLFLILGAIQFELRALMQGDHFVASDFFRIYTLFYHVTGELLAIGAITFNTVSLVNLNDMTFGLDTMLHALNSIPFIRIGDKITMFLDLKVSDLYGIITPYGGLSMLSEAWISAGWIGVGMFSVISGVFLAWMHRFYCFNVSYGRFNASFKNMYLFGLSATILSMYRNGLADMIGFILSYSILYVLFVMMPWLIRKSLT